MRTFIQKPKPTQQTTFARPAMPQRTHLGQGRELGSSLYLQRTIGDQSEAEKHTGMPSPLRTGLEQLSGMDLSGVRVHTNSSKPSKINALAYAQGQNIYVGPGQEKHIPHEGWHVVQQMRGGVNPTMQKKGVSINNDANLEREANVMGTKALQMQPTAQAATGHATRMFMPLQPVVQRTIGDGHDLSAPWLAGDAVLEAIYDNERLMRNGSRGTAVKKVQQLLFYLGFDFPAYGADGIFGAETEAAVKSFQRANVDESGVQLVDDGIVGPLTMGALNREANRTGTNIGNLIRTAPLPALHGPPTASPTPLSVDRIDVVDSGVGAIGGYPPIVGGASLNTPGPFSDPVTGETKNSLQIHFHLDHGSSASLTPRRELQRTSVVRGAVNENPPAQVLPPGVYGPPVPGGFTGLRVGPDGPAPHEIQRPTADTIVVADAPGINRATTAADYPISYRSHFFLTVENVLGAPIARIIYDVLIRRTSLANIPNAENRVVATEKKDFVRGKNL